MERIAFSRRIGTKILATLVAVSLFTILITGAALITLSSTTLRTNISERNQQIARRASNEIDLYIRNSLDDLEAVADILAPLSDPWVRDILLENLSVTFGKFRTLYLATRAGKIIASSSLTIPDGNTVDPDTLNAFASVRQGGPVISPVRLSEERLPFMTIALPVAVADQPAAMLIAELDLRHIWELVDNIGFGGSGEALLLSNQGLLIAHPDKTKVLAPAEENELPGEITGAESGEGVVVYKTPGGTRVLLAFSPVRSAGWTVVIRQPLAEAYLPVDQVLIRSTFLLAAVLVAAVLASMFMARHFSSPLNLLLAGTLRIGRGQLDHRIDLPNKDEIGRLAASFNRMVQELQSWSGRLRESEERYRLMAESIQDIIFSLDKDGRLLFVNRQAEAVSGYPPQVLQGRECMEFLSQKSRDEIGTLLRLDFHSIMQEGLEVEIVTREGLNRILEVKLVQVFDSFRRLQFFGVARDITQRKEAERKLQVYQQQLRSLASQLSLVEARERKRIAADLHDRIGQALALTQIKLDTMRNGTASGKLAKSLSDTMTIIDQTIHDVRGLIFDLSSPLLYEVGLKAALEQLAEQFQNEHGIRVSLVDDALPKPLEDDGAVLLYQAVRELLVNVAKHAGARHVHIILCRFGETVQITVHDDGIGFDVFRTDFKPGEKGGFGLFNIRERLEYMGGSLLVESAPGMGTKASLAMGLNRDTIENGG